MARGMRGFRAAGEGCSLLGVTAWPLVGRGDQLERLVQAMTAGGRASLLVAGPAGIGKTRLLAEARGRAEAAGVEVHSALGTGAWAELPFGALAHLLPAGAGPDDLPAMLTATTAMLAGDGTRRVAGHHRQLATQFGTVRVTRCAWRRPGAGNLYPADAALSLPTSRHSHTLTRLAALEAARGSFEAAHTAITRRCGPVIGKRQVEQAVVNAAGDIAAFYAARIPMPCTASTLLVISADSKGVVMRPEALRAATAKAAARQGRMRTGSRPGRSRTASGWPH
jgi:hypothetical protein